MDERTQQLLERLGLTTRDTTGAMQQLLSALSRTTGASNNQTNAATVAAQSLQQLQGSSNRLATGLSSALSVGTGFVSGLTSLTASIYGADKAFTSVIPTLSFITNTFTKSVTAAGTALSGLSVKGFSFGRASEAAAAGVTATFEVLSDVIKFQIESAQKVSDQFQELTKVGATFGGSIGTMGAVAKELRIPLLQFGRVITSNVESLSKLGVGITDAGARVVSFGMDLYDKEDSLLALYGSIENISEGVADFMALQAGLGKAQTTDYYAQRNSIKEYLIRQKELTAITGQSADALKKAEEERRKDLAYQLKVSRMSPIAQENIKEGFAIAQAKFGDEAAQYLKEYVRTQGKITDPAMIAYANGNQEVARTMQMFAENVNLSRDDFRRNYAGFIKENAGAYRGFAESIEDLAELPPQLMNPFVQSMTKQGASLIANMGFFEDLPATVERMIAEGTKLRDVLTDPATKAFVDAERDRARIQREIDTTVLTNMQNIGSTIKYLNEITLAMVKAQGSISELLDQLKKAPQAAADFNKSVGNMVDDIFRKMNIQLPDSSERGSDFLSTLRELFSGNRTLPVSVNPGQSPIPVTVVSGQGTPTAQSGPTIPSTPVAALAAAEADLFAALARRNENNTPSSENNVVMAMVERLQSQVAAMSAANGNTEQVVAALTDQNGLMATLNDKMGELIDSNKSIFNALA
jgi:hypothetical protein